MKNPSITASLLLLASGVAFAGRVEDTDASVAFGGNNAWQSVSDSQASGGAYMVSGSVGATVAFSFSGTSITLWRELDPTGGSATVQIDNKPWGSINFYFYQRAYQVPAVIDQLSSGNHTLQLTVASMNPFSNSGQTGNPGNNVYIDAFETPSTVTPSSAQQTALARINTFRTLAGLPAANLSAALDLAAQAHADYNGTNHNGPGSGVGLDAHTELSNNPGFVGSASGDRASHFGYPQNTGEDAASYTDPTLAVDIWLSTVYHRSPLMAYYNTDLGFGVNQDGGTVLDFGTQHSGNLSARQIVTFPANNQKDVLLSFSGESPNPIPNQTGPFGYPASVHIQQPVNLKQTNPKDPTTGSLKDGAGNNIGVILIDRNTDPNPGFNGSDDYFLVPMNPLNPGTTYTATMSGTDSTGSAFNVSWKFTTVLSTAISNIHSSLQGWTYVIGWSTAGPVSSTQVNYGLTTSYGSTAAGSGYGSLISFTADLDTLPGGTYHYQITATDANGTSTSPDATFVIPDTPAASVKLLGSYPYDQNSCYLLWQTYGAVSSTSVLYGTTTSYGQTAAGNPANGVANQWGATLRDLTPGTTYHYQMMATDSKGNIKTTPDMTFTTPGTAPPSSPTTPATLSGSYKLIPQNASSLCLDVFAAGTAPGTGVDGWACNGGSNQSFNLVSQGNGIYVIQPSYATGLCLDVYGGGASAPGTSVDVWTCHGGTNQQWQLISDGGNIYELAPQNAAGLRLDVYGAGTSNGTQIDVWTATGGSNQKWALMK